MASTTRNILHTLLLRPAQALSEASWLYPFKGLAFFVTHPFLWPLLRTRLLPCFLLSILVFGNLFVWTYLPQVAFIAIFHGAGAWLNGTFLVLGEGLAIVSILFEAFFVDEAQVDIFDAVLIAQGFEDLISTARSIDSEGTNPIRRLGKPTRSAVYAPFSFRQIFEFVVFLPLNLIPFVGVPIFLLLTGYRAGPLSHWRWFKLHELSKKERDALIKKRRWQYTWFGTVSLLLQLVPVLNMLFLLTTACGSALWVAKLERQQRLGQGRHSDEPDYTDDPV